MAQNVKIWYDAEGDFLEVTLSDQPGHMRESLNDSVMERVNEQGQLLGFSILNVSHLSRDHPLVAQLQARLAGAA